MSEFRDSGTCGVDRSAVGYAAMLAADPSARRFPALHPVAAQFVRFAMLGGVGTAAQYATLIAFVRVLHGDPLVGSVAGCVTGMLVNYFLCRRYAFRSRASHRHALWRFVLVATIGLLLNTAVLSVLVRVAGLHYLLAQVIATAVVLVWNFVPNRLWTFAPHREGSLAEGA